MENGEDFVASEKRKFLSLKLDITADEEMIKRFQNELKLARKISHRNVCRMYDLSEAEDVPFITMEYMSPEQVDGK